MEGAEEGVDHVEHEGEEEQNPTVVLRAIPKGKGKEEEEEDKKGSAIHAADAVVSHLDLSWGEKLASLVVAVNQTRLVLESVTSAASLGGWGMAAWEGGGGGGGGDGRTRKQHAPRRVVPGIGILQPSSPSSSPFMSPHASDRGVTSSRSRSSSSSSSSSTSHASSHGWEEEGAEEKKKKKTAFLFPPALETSTAHRVAQTWLHAITPLEQQASRLLDLTWGRRDVGREHEHQYYPHGRREVEEEEIQIHAVMALTGMAWWRREKGGASTTGTGSTYTLRVRGGGWGAEDEAGAEGGWGFAGTTPHEDDGDDWGEGWG